MIAGVGFSVLAALTITLGNLVEKRAVDNMESISARRIGALVASLLRSRLWLTGFVISLVALALQVVAFSLAPLVIVQTMSSIGLALLVYVSRRHFHERIGRRDALGLAVLLVALACVSGSLGSGTRVGLAGSSSVVVLVTAATGAVAALLVFALSRRDIDIGFLFGLSSGLLYGAAALGTKGASTIVARDGLLASVPHILVSPFPYVFVVASVGGLALFQTGLQRSRIALVAPLSTVTSSVYVVALGMPVFGEHLPSVPAIAALRLFGFAAVLVGAFVLAGSDPDLAVTSGPAPGGTIRDATGVQQTSEPWQGPSSRTEGARAGSMDALHARDGREERGLR